MKHILRALILCTAVQGGVALAAGPQAPASEAAAGYKVIRAEFGLLDFKKAGPPKFAPAQVVPHVTGQGYGWVIAIRNTKSKVKWREEITLPARPASWGAADPKGVRFISRDGLTAVTEIEDSPPRGVISNAWTIAAGDPKGHYVIRVFIDGTLAKVFEFDVK